MDHSTRDITRRFVERVKPYKARLGEIEPSTIEKILQDLRRDANPERELEIWERITDAYVMYVEKNNVGLPKFNNFDRFTAISRFSHKLDVCFSF